MNVRLFEKITRQNTIHSIATTETEVLYADRYNLIVLLFDTKINNLKPKTIISIGSTINAIDAKRLNETLVVGLACNDGSIHLISFTDDFQIESHRKSLIYELRAKYVFVVDEDTVVSAGDDFYFSISQHTKRSCAEKLKIPYLISAISYFDKKIFIGTTNGSLFVSDMDGDFKLINDYNERIVSIGIISTDDDDCIAVLTENEYYELEMRHKKYTLKSKVQYQQCYVTGKQDLQNSNRYVAWGKDNILTILSNGKKVVSTALDHPITDAIFFGDFVLVILDNMIYMFELIHK